MSGKQKGSFQSLNLSSNVLSGISKLGFRNPTPVQRQALPVILSGSDAIVMARTGSGKTLAFVIPILEKLQENTSVIRAVILSPTRELSLQTLSVLRKLSGSSTLKSIGIHGGEGMEKQFGLLSSKPDIIVATPGRLAHHVSEIPDLSMSNVEICVLDEADRMLEMGFGSQIRSICKHMRCQKVLLSATMPKVLVEFTKSGFCVDPKIVRLDQEATVSDELRMGFLNCRSLEKDAVLLYLLHHLQQQKGQEKGLTLIFAATRHHVEYICTLLQASNLDCTMIYGSLDHEARQENLKSFRSAKIPILVVTDVAARGIDIPIIDHVIHYHFPDNERLFVHRSGRAARAGRIGYCWGLVEPDELGYLMDLYLFLGKTPATSNDSYTLSEMTPDTVHYGALPEAVLNDEMEHVQRLLNSELAGSHFAQSLRNLSKVCNNGMQQYKRTRREASREGVKMAKAVLEGEKLSSGQRIAKSAIPVHPLFVTKSSDLQIQRQDFLNAMSNFRPKETVFEAFAKGGARSVVSHIDKGRTTSLRDDASVIAMKDMRRQVRMARDKSAALVVAGSEAAEELAQEEQPIAGKPTQQKREAPIETKRRMSKADRRRLKKNPTAATSKETASSKPKSRVFRDPNFFIDNEVTSDRSRRVEAAMHSKSRRLEESMMDIVGDENEELIKKQRVMRWDKAKRKYVKTTVGDELNNESKTKKLRLESGQLVKNNKLNLGELYQKWQKKTNRSIGRTGVFDDEHAGTKQTNDEVKTSATIKKERGRKQNLKIKNMKRSDRRKLEQKDTK